MKNWKIIGAFIIAMSAAFYAGGRLMAAPASLQQDPGYVVRTDAEVAEPQAGTHDGGGSTTGYSYFADVPNLHFVFRKRALHPGSAIGYHPHTDDEIYYVESGHGIMQENGKEFPVGPGTAILTRPGSSHGLRQTGSEDLVIFIVYIK